jgi:iron complex outermembrane receptor protein
VTQCQPGNITVSGVSYAIPAGGVTAANAGALVAGTSNRCDLIKNADLLPMQNHNSAAFTFHQEVGPVVSLFADGFVMRRDFTFHGGPVSGNLTVPRANAFFVAPPGTNPSTETVGYAFTNDFGLNNDSFGYSVAYQATLGADVKLPHDWKFETDYTYGRDDDRSTAYNLNNAALNAALASSNPATAFNPFGAANSPSVLANLKNSAFIAPGRTTQQEFEGKFDGPLATLPGGDLRAALGGEFLHQEIWSGLNSGPPTALTAYRIPASRDVRSGYVEVFVPVVGSGNAMPGVQRLDIDLAGRYESYSDQGTTANPKFGVNWSPAHGWLLRGSYGTSFRAPLLAQTHPASTALYVQNYSDPTSSTGVTQGLTLSGASSNLKPETAKTYSAGVDFEPDFLPRAKFSLTYFDIAYENQITSYLSDLTLLQRESYFSQIITRNPDPAYIRTLTSKYVVNGVLPSPLLLFVNGQSLNLGKSVTRGFDFQATYRLPPMSWGDVTLGLNGTYLTTYDVAVTSSAPLQSQLNTIFNPLQFRARGSAAWRKDGWDGVLFLNYTNGYKNNRVTPVQNVDAFTTVDVNLGYTFGDNVLHGWAKGVKLAVDARNLFDAKPPFVNIAPSPNGGGGFDPTAADPIGRVIGITIDKKW